MNTCFCGNPIGEDGILCARCAALRVLELDSYATEKQIKASYRLLVKVWHPDRFQNDATLKWEAEAKLKKVNAAYSVLNSTFGNPKRSAKRARAEATSQGVPGTPTSTSTTGWIPEPEAPKTLATWLRWTSGILIKVCVLAFVILIGRYLWIAFDLPALSIGDLHRAYDAGLDKAAPELQGPQHRFLNAIEHDLRRLGLNGTAAAVTAAQQSDEAAAKADETPQSEPPPIGKPTKKQTGKNLPAPRVIHSFITVGSTRDEVIAQQGPPTASSDDKVVYGRSELDLKDGAVVGWRIDPVSNPIRVKLWPEHSVDTSQDFFSVDSTRDDVLVVQGTPTAFSNDKFEYGGSEVYFRNNRVVSWKNDLSSIPLRVGNP